jgi:hypothetical protein
LDHGVHTKKLCLLERDYICTSTGMCTKLGEGEPRDWQIEVAKTSDMGTWALVSCCIP